MKIEVRPIVKKQWHGKTGKESFTRPKKLQALVDGRTRLYATGLDNEKRTYKKHPRTGKQLSKEDWMTEQEYYAGLLKVDLSPHFTEGEAHPFWDSSTAVIKLENNTMIFDESIPLDYVKIKMLKASKYVANSMKEYDEGLYPEATHVITDEKEETQVKASKVAIKNKAVIEAYKLSKDRKIQLILILDHKNLKGRSDDSVEVALDKLISSKPKDVLRYIEQDAEDVAIHSLILEALQKSVLRKQGHKILFHDSVIGSDIYDVIEYLKNNENQDLKLRIMAQVND